MHPPTSFRPLPAAALALALAACSWSVPADPGLNAARRSPDAFAASAPGGGPLPAQALGGAGPDDPVARGLYVARCGRCHTLYAPRHVAPEAWPGILQRMAPRAGLFGANRRRVTDWLVANAR